MTNEQQIFIEEVAKACIENKDYNILPSLTIAQAIKESNWGKSGLSKKAFNFFGMKWTSSCKCDYIEMPTKEWNGKEYITINAKFRKYKNFSDGIKGYYDFISGYKRYKNLIGEKDSKKACMLIQKDGWATSPTYGTSLYNDYVLKYDLLKYDHMDAVPVPEQKKENILKYTVVKGDSLWRIAERFYNNGNMWTKIKEDNNLSSHIIKVGQIIEIRR